MWLNVSVIVSLPEDGEACRDRFSREMEQRGWWSPSEAPDQYRIAIRGASDDEQIVKMCARDVHRSAYVAGVSAFQATCLIAPGDDHPEIDSAGSESAGDASGPADADSDAA